MEAAQANLLINVGIQPGKNQERVTADYADFTDENGCNFLCRSIPSAF